MLLSRAFAGMLFAFLLFVVCNLCLLYFQRKADQAYSIAHALSFVGLPLDDLEEVETQMGSADDVHEFITGLAEAT